MADTSKESAPQRELTFDGATFEQPLDGSRLTAQLDDVRVLMADGKWRTLAAVASALNAPEASVSARLRDLRKEKFGGHTVNRRRVAAVRGLHEYQLVQKGH